MQLACEALPAASKPEEKRLSIAWVSVAVYLASFWLPLRGDVPLLLLAAGSFIAVAFQRRPLGATPLVVATLLFLAVTAAETFSSIDPQRSIALNIQLFPGCLLFLLISQYFTRSDLRRLAIALCWISAVWALVFLWTAWVARGQLATTWVGEEPTLLLVSKNDVVLFALLAPLALSAAVGASRWSVSASCAGSIVVGAAVVIAYQSRGALLTAIAGVFCWFVLVNKKFALQAAATFLVGAIGLDQVFQLGLLERLGDTVTSRVSYWITATDMFRDAPWLGQGPRSFGLVFDRYFDGAAFPEWITPAVERSPWAHSLYLETLAEQGIVGFTALALLLACAWIAVVRSLSGRGSDRVEAAGYATALACFCFAASFELSLLRLWVAILFFVLLGQIAAFDRIRRGDEISAALLLLPDRDRVSAHSPFSAQHETDRGRVA